MNLCPLSNVLRAMEKVTMPKSPKGPLKKASSIAKYNLSDCELSRHFFQSYPRTTT